MNKNCEYYYCTELHCQKCHREVFSDDTPDYPGQLCSECFFKGRFPSRNSDVKSREPILAYFYGTCKEVNVPAHIIIRYYPGKDEDGSCAYDILAVCASYEAALAAYRFF